MSLFLQYFFLKNIILFSLMGIEDILYIKNKKKLIEITIIKFLLTLFLSLILNLTYTVLPNLYKSFSLFISVLIFSLLFFIFDTIKHNHKIKYIIYKLKIYSINSYIPLGISYIISFNKNSFLEIFTIIITIFLSFFVVAYIFISIKEYIKYEVIKKIFDNQYIFFIILSCLGYIFSIFKNLEV